jgi:Integrase core domain
MAESFVDSFKTELIADRVWRTQAQLELAIVEYISWFNHDRLHEALGDIPPIEFEAATCSNEIRPRRGRLGSTVLRHSSLQDKPSRTTYKLSRRETRSGSHIRPPRLGEGVPFFV